MTIDYKNVSIYHGEHKVLEHVNLQTREGEMVYLIGPVGSGKSSLLKTIYGHLEISEGEAMVLGTDMRTLKTRHIPQLRRQMGIVFQDFQLLNDRNINDNMEFVLRSTGWKNAEERKNRIEEVLQEVGLKDVGEKKPYELSGGEQQRVCIARAILNHPKLILADEPTGNLDRDNGERVLAILDEIRRQQGATIVLTTHNLQWLEDFPGTVYTCDRGELRLQREA